MKNNYSQYLLLCINLSIANSTDVTIKIEKTCLTFLYNFKETTLLVTDHVKLLLSLFLKPCQTRLK